jgi:hypothetical protein
MVLVGLVMPEKDREAKGSAHDTGAADPKVGGVPKGNAIAADIAYEEVGVTMWMRNR